MAIMTQMRRCFAVVALAGATFAAGAALAAGDPDKAAKYPEKHKWGFDGIFGTFDKEAVQRGYKVYREVCASCHAMELLSFRNLGQKGGPFFLEDYPNPNDNPYVKAIAAEYVIEDGPDDVGDMFERPGLPSDRFPSPFENEMQARASNGGSYPPDLSLIIKARKDGANYMASLMKGYQPAPEGVEVPPGQYYNPYFEGRMIAMAPPLIEGMVTYDDGSPETLDQYVKDLTYFLTWAAEPKMEARKQLGFMVMGYLFLFTGLVYWSYRKIWADEH